MKVKINFQFTIFFIAIQAINTQARAEFNTSTVCKAASSTYITPVVELYTSEGCSSCPPADKWLSTLKNKTTATISANPVVIQAFHVNYWDYIGWPDRFATPAHTNRQRQISAWNKQNGIYTPQMVLNGQDWRGWGGSSRNVTASTVSTELAKSSISLLQTGADQFEAVISPVAGANNPPATWSAYWTITEHGHVTKVKAGENNGETLLHDYVVRQYTPVGDYSATSPQKLNLRGVATTPGHERQVNLVVFDPKTGKTIQAVSASCSS
ncbi:MAG: hypothetical protein RL761_1737 [Pseudomonadota bacterium]|jgi:hypothetical protein